MFIFDLLFCNCIPRIHNVHISTNVHPSYLPVCSYSLETGNHILDFQSNTFLLGKQNGQFMDCKRITYSPLLRLEEKLL